MPIGRLLSIWLMAMAVYPNARAADLLEAYRDAAAGDPQLRSAAATSQAAQERPSQARALLLPNLSASFNRSRTFDFTTDTAAAEFAFDAHSHSLTLTQPLYNRQAQVQVRQAKPVALQAEADYAAARQDLVLRVATLYFNVLRDQDDLTFVLADEKAIARQLEQAKRRFEVGLLTVTDVYEAQARYDLAVAAEIDARNQLAGSLEALQEVTGTPYARLQGLDEKMPLQPVEPADPEVWVETALDDNPQLASAAFGVEIARLNIELQKAGHYPTLTLSVSRFDSDTGFVESSGNRLGLQLVIPLYQGGAVDSRTREAAYQYEAAKENLEQRQRQIVRQVRNAYQGFETARRRIQALEQAVVSNRSALEATQAGFEVGTRTIVDVLNAERDLLQAQRDLSVSRYDYLINWLQLLQGAGRLGVEDLAAINAWLRVPGPLEPVKAKVERPQKMVK